MARMRDPVLTPQQAAAARRAAALAREQEHADALERRQRMQQVGRGRPDSVTALHLRLYKHKGTIALRWFLVLGMSSCVLMQLEACWCCRNLIASGARGAVFMCSWRRRGGRARRQVRRKPQSAQQKRRYAGRQRPQRWRGRRRPWP